MEGLNTSANQPTAFCTYCKQPLNNVPPELSRRTKDESPMQCPFCDRIFKRSNGWARHMTVNHLDLYDSYDTSSTNTWKIYAKYKSGLSKQDIQANAAERRRYLDQHNKLIIPQKDNWNNRVAYLVDQHEKTKFEILN